MKINGTEYETITNINWLDTLEAEQMDHTSTTAVHRRLVATGQVIEPDDWDAIYALLGQQCSVYATAYSSRNTYKTYYGAILKKAEHASHPGPILTGITLEFLVRAYD